MHFRASPTSWLLRGLERPPDPRRNGECLRASYLVCNIFRGNSFFTLTCLCNCLACINSVSGCLQLTVSKQNVVQYQLLSVPSIDSTKCGYTTDMYYDTSHKYGSLGHLVKCYAKLGICYYLHYPATSTVNTRNGSYMLELTKQLKILILRGSRKFTLIMHEGLMR